MSKLEIIFYSILGSTLFRLLWNPIQNKPDIQNYIVAPCLVAFLVLVMISEKKTRYIYIFWHRSKDINIFCHTQVPPLPLFRIRPIIQGWVSITDGRVELV